jgi:hypothetical protein
VEVVGVHGVHDPLEPLPLGLQPLACCVVLHADHSTRPHQGTWPDRIERAYPSGGIIRRASPLEPIGS